MPSIEPMSRFYDELDFARIAAGVICCTRCLPNSVGRCFAWPSAKRDNKMTARYYRDFVLYADSPEFESGNAGGRPTEYMVRVFDSPEGEGEEPETVAVDDWDQLDEWRRSLSDRSISNDELTKFGLRMGQMILPPTARDLYFRSLAALAESEDGLRVRLRLFPALDVLPWEYTRVTPREGGLDISELIFLDPKISIVRHQPVATPAQPFRTGTDTVSSSPWQAQG